MWGGHKGSAIALAVQLLGVLAGGWAASPDHRQCGYFVCVIDPAILLDPAAYRATISDYLRSFESAARLDPQQPVRLPFARSAQERRRQLALGYIVVPATIHRQLCELADGQPIADLRDGQRQGRGATARRRLRSSCRPLNRWQRRRAAAATAGR